MLHCWCYYWKDKNFYYICYIIVAIENN